jgi:hypothetical protein
MVWKEVALRYLDVFSQVKRERESGPGGFPARTMGSVPREIPQPKLDHIIRLTDDVGILQHAKFIVPDRFHGYCIDDNARALIAVLLAREMWPTAKPSPTWPAPISVFCTTRSTRKTAVFAISWV